ncbi:DUF6412 domain-containing protein [Streptomyces sp. NBC_01171]|uniref:DUF6412 domain-containing protein n=1 Tax=Streptomyces sp. NBC_01171 TaxID=2903757 RepID=UPI00386C3BF6|nr:DUF6412 domain-containing protein [Streptomyces sp. NBC_01171]
MHSGSAVTRALLPLLAVAQLIIQLLLLQAALLGSGDLTTAVALAATTAAGTALALCSVLTARRVPVVPPTRVRTAIRDRARRTAFLAQRDPDARGRRRPRAPGRVLPTTCA